MKANWKSIRSAPKDGTQIMLTDGQSIEPGTWNKNSNFCYHRISRANEAGEKSNYYSDGGWELNGLTSDESDRLMVATHWDYMPQLPNK